MKRIYCILATSLALFSASGQVRDEGMRPEIEEKVNKVESGSLSSLSYAWRLLPPLGLRESADIDTLLFNYSLKSVPSAVSAAYATTGNLGAEGCNLIYFERPEASDFFFMDALRAWIPSESNTRFYNTRVPMTLLSYNFGGDKQTGQDRLNAVFSGNINSKAQVGAMLDYIYSKGSYNYQATKDLTYGFSGSYIGDRYEFQGFFNQYNLLNKENGGITDDLYITDPAEIQGGNTSVDFKTIPTRLNAAHNRIVGTELYLNNKYKVGFWRDMPMAEGDTIAPQEYVPVSSFIWTLDFRRARHTFVNTNASQDHEFWENSYLTPNGTDDRSSYWSLRNTLGVSLLEGFNKYAKAGLALFATYEFRSFKQPVDTVDRSVALPDKLSPLPFAVAPTGDKQSLMWIGAQITRQQGRILNYEATGELGIVGEAAGEVKISGNISTHIPLMGDTVSVVGYGLFHNVSVPYFLKHYVSNHFSWDNDFGKTRRARFGGELKVRHTGTSVNIGVENVQNLIYFNSLALPRQASGSVQVFNATLRQDFHFGLFYWQNRVTYQTSSSDEVIPLPKLAIYSNMFVNFKVAGVLDVQFGVDCDYYTKYKALGYQPATMSFYNQREVECGNYPFMNAYINMKLSKTRFYLMFSHVNQGWFGNNYFSMPHYPLNPRRFQLGLSIDFAN